MFGVTPDIKIISFGVRRLKNRRVTPNREEILSKYCSQHCFICRPSESAVSEDAGIEPKTAVSSALAVRRSNYLSTRAWAASGRVCTTEECAVPRGVYTTVAWAVFWTCLHYRGLCSSWRCLHYRGLSFIWTCLHYRGLCSSWRCLHYRGLSCIWTCLHYRGMCCSWRCLPQGLSCIWTCLHYRGMCCSLRCLHYRGLSCFWTRLHYRGLSCIWTCLHYRGLCVPGGVYTTEAWAASGRVCTTEACAVPGGVYTTGAWAASGRVCTTEACYRYFSIVQNSLFFRCYESLFWRFQASFLRFLKPKPVGLLNIFLKTG